MRLQKPFVLLLYLVILYSCQYTETFTYKLPDSFEDVSKLKLEKPHLFLDTLALNQLSDDYFLERIQFDYTKDIFLKSKSDELVVEKEGYRINLFCVAIKNEWMQREKGALLVLQKLKEYKKVKHREGFFPRSFNRTTGDFIPGKEYFHFGQPYDVVGTAFLATSLKFVVKQFFDQSNAIETEIRNLCDEIVKRINWDFAYRIDRKCFTWFKNGQNGERFDGKDLIGEMDETYFIQLLVLSSSNWSHGNEAYNNYISKLYLDHQYGFTYYSTKQYDYKNSEQFSGITVKNLEHQKLNNYPTAKLGYLVQSHLWFDLLGYRDSTCTSNNLDYFQSVQNAIKAQIQYAKLNPGKNYFYGKVWGFYDTWSPVSKKWMVTGLPAEGDYDEGTIAVSAVLSSINFQPQASLSCLRALYNEFKADGIYGNSGFHMSVNTNSRRVAPNPDYFFQPINVLSIENYRSGLFWKMAKREPDYQKAFQKAGLISETIQK